MIKFTFGFLNQHPVEASLTKLASCTTLDARTAYQVAKHLAKVTAELKTAREIFSKLVLQHAVVDEKGAPVKAENGELQLKDKAAYDAALAEFLKVEFEYDRRKLSLSELEKSGLSALEIAALDPIIEEE